MLQVAPGASFEATTDRFATGLTGTRGARIRNGVGGSFLARTTAGIAEDVTVASSAVYRRTFTAPQTQGQYWLIWDDGTSVEREELLVAWTAATVATASGRDLCTLTDVTDRVPGYSPGDDADIDQILTTLITQESRDFVEVTHRELISISAADDPTARVFELDWLVARERELQIGDATEVTAVVFKQEDGTVIQTLAGSAWTPLPRSRDDWQPITSLYFPAGASTPAVLPRHNWTRESIYGGSSNALWLAEVTGSWGFPAIPDTVRRAVATLTLFRYLNEVASAGTKLADIVNRENFNLASALRAAFEVRERLTVTEVG